MKIDLKDEKKLYVCVGIVSALLFLVVFGYRIMIPTYDDWLYSGFDLNQHYLGWRAFRASPWHFPIGLMDGLNYPNQVSIIYTDSIPLFAILFKILSPILPETFQYFGLWGLTSFVITGVLAARILYQWIQSKIAVVCGALLLLLQPVMLWKMFHHTALAGQWILLLSIYLLFFSKKKKWYAPLLLGYLATNIHIYFVLMCGILFVGYAYNLWIKEKQMMKAVLSLVEYIGTVGVVIALLGGFCGGVNSAQ